MRSKEQPRILIMAGGTGGHVFPALAVAKLMQTEGITVEWLGTTQGIEASLVPNAGYVLHYITITGARRKNGLTRLLLPFRLMLALFQSLKIIARFKPHAVLGMGGFASGPGGIAAWLLRRPLIVHEQNAIAGVTNRILASFAKRVLEGFPNSFTAQGNRLGFLASQPIWVGNPVRAELCQLPLPIIRNQGRTGRLCILIIGGSQGAAALNALCPQALEKIPLDERPDVWHQTGRDQLEKTRARYEACHIKAKVEPFIQDMQQAYEWADLVVCRAGALTVAELAAVGVASILVPFPFAVDDHQTHNGRFLETIGAARLFSQEVLDQTVLADTILSFSRDRANLYKMAEMARTVAQPEASHKVLANCKEVWCEPKKS